MKDLMEEIDEAIEADVYLQKRVEEQSRKGWRPKGQPTLTPPSAINITPNPYDYK